MISKLIPDEYTVYLSRDFISTNYGSTRESCIFNCFHFAFNSAAWTSTQHSLPFYIQLFRSWDQIKESAAVLLINRRRQRHRQRRARRQAWVYPRPQGWFEEMYTDRLPSSHLERPFQDNTGNIRFYLLVERDLQKEERESKFIEITAFVQKDDKLSSK